MPAVSVHRRLTLNSSLGYVLSTRPAWDVERDTDSKTDEQTKQAMICFSPWKTHLLPLWVWSLVTVCAGDGFPDLSTCSTMLIVTHSLKCHFLKGGFSSVTGNVSHLCIHVG